MSVDDLLRLATDLVALSGPKGISAADFPAELSSYAERSDVPPPSASVAGRVWRALPGVPGIELVDAPDGAPSELAGTAVACRKLRDTALGVVELQECTEGSWDGRDREALEKLGQARHSGRLQADLATELGVSNTSFFHTINSLVMKSLAVKSPIVVPGANGGKTSTNICFLTRFAPNVNTAGNKRLVPATEAEGGGEFALADDADMMARISRHLEAAGDKPVVESELKVLLGFSGTPGHRSWRRIRGKLEAGNHLKQVPAKVGGKSVTVLRLLKPFRRDSAAVVEEEEETSPVLTPIVESGLARQILDHVVSGTHVTTTQVWDAMGVSGKYEAKVLATVEKMFGLKKTMHGKGRSNYFVYEAPPEVLALYRERNRPTLAALEGWQRDLGVDAEEPRGHAEGAAADRAGPSTSDADAPRPAVAATPPTVQAVPVPAPAPTPAQAAPPPVAARAPVPVPPLAPVVGEDSGSSDDGMAVDEEGPAEEEGREAREPSLRTYARVETLIQAMEREGGILVRGVMAQELAAASSSKRPDLKVIQRLMQHAVASGRARIVSVPYEGKNGKQRSVEALVSAEIDVNDDVIAEVQERFRRSAVDVRKKRGPVQAHEQLNRDDVFTVLEPDRTLAVKKKTARNEPRGNAEHPQKLLIANGYEAAKGRRAARVHALLVSLLGWGGGERRVPSPAELVKELQRRIPAKSGLVASSLGMPHIRVLEDRQAAPERPEEAEGAAGAGGQEATTPAPGLPHVTEDTILFDDLLAQMPVATAAACMGFPVRELDVVALDAQYARMSDVPDDLRDPLLDSQNVKRLHNSVLLLQSLGLVKIRTCMGVKFTRGVKVKAYINLIDVARSVDLQVPVDPIGARASLMAEFDALEALAQKSWGAKGGRAHGSSGSSSGSEDGGDGEGEGGDLLAKRLRPVFVFPEHVKTVVETRPEHFALDQPGTLEDYWLRLEWLLERHLIPMRYTPLGKAMPNIFRRNTVVFSARLPPLDVEVRKDIREKLQDLGISQTQVTPTDWLDCKRLADRMGLPYSQIIRIARERVSRKGPKVEAPKHATRSGVRLGGVSMPSTKIAFGESGWEFGDVAAGLPQPESHMELPERLFQAIKSKPVAAVPEHVTAFKKRKTDAGRQRRERERQRRAAEGRDEEGVEDDEDVDDDEGGSEEEDGEGGLLEMEGAGEGGGSREGRPRGPTMVWRREEDMAWMLKLAHSYIMTGDNYVDLKKRLATPEGVDMRAVGNRLRAYRRIKDASTALMGLRVQCLVIHRILKPNSTAGTAVPSRRAQQQARQADRADKADKSNDGPQPQPGDQAVADDDSGDSGGDEEENAGGRGTGSSSKGSYGAILRDIGLVKGGQLVLPDCLYLTEITPADDTLNMADECTRELMHVLFPRGIGAAEGEGQGEGQGDEAGPSGEEEGRTSAVAEIQAAVRKAGLLMAVTLARAPRLKGGEGRAGRRGRGAEEAGEGEEGGNAVATKKKGRRHRGRLVDSARVEDELGDDSQAAVPLRPTTPPTMRPASTFRRRWPGLASGGARRTASLGASMAAVALTHGLLSIDAWSADAERSVLETVRGICTEEEISGGVAILNERVSSASKHLSGSALRDALAATLDASAAAPLFAEAGPVPQSAAGPSGGGEPVADATATPPMALPVPELPDLAPTAFEEVLEGRSRAWGLPPPLLVEDGVTSRRARTLMAIHAMACGAGTISLSLTDGDGDAEAWLAGVQRRIEEEGDKEGAPGEGEERPTWRSVPGAAMTELRALLMSRGQGGGEPGEAARGEASLGGEGGEGEGGGRGGAGRKRAADRDGEGEGEGERAEKRRRVDEAGAPGAKAFAWARVGAEAAAREAAQGAMAADAGDARGACEAALRRVREAGRGGVGAEEVAAVVGGDARGAMDALERLRRFGLVRSLHSFGGPRWVASEHSQEFVVAAKKVTERGGLAEAAGDAAAGALAARVRAEAAAGRQPEWQLWPWLGPGGDVGDGVVERAAAKLVWAATLSPGIPMQALQAQVPSLPAAASAALLRSLLRARLLEPEDAFGECKADQDGLPAFLSASRASFCLKGRLDQVVADALASTLQVP